MKKFFLTATIAGAMLLGAAQSVEAHAIIPQPSTKQFYCYHFGSHIPFPCWCDVWLRYPICRRWHWHDDGGH